MDVPDGCHLQSMRFEDGDVIQVCKTMGLPREMSRNLKGCGGELHYQGDVLILYCHVRKPLQNLVA